MCAPFRISRQMRPSLSASSRVRRRDSGGEVGRLTDVGVVDLGEETDLRWAHRVLFWQE